MNPTTGPAAPDEPGCVLAHRHTGRSRVLGTPYDPEGSDTRAETIHAGEPAVTRRFPARRAQRFTYHYDDRACLDTQRGTRRHRITGSAGIAHTVVMFRVPRACTWGRSLWVVRHSDARTTMTTSGTTHTSAQRFEHI